MPPLQLPPPAAVDAEAADAAAAADAAVTATASDHSRLASLRAWRYSDNFASLRAKNFLGVIFMVWGFALSVAGTTALTPMYYAWEGGSGGWAGGFIVAGSPEDGSDAEAKNKVRFRRRSSRGAGWGRGRPQPAPLDDLRRKRPFFRLLRRHRHQTLDLIR